MNTSTLKTDSFLHQYGEAQAEMKELMERYVTLWTSGDLEAVMTYFSDTELDYSDYGLMALHMDKQTLIPHFQKIATTFGEMEIKTTGIYGALDFCIWEFIFEFTILVDEPVIPYKKGERGKMFSASVIEWKDGKIVKERDYAVWGK
ncbi:hypothetical protein GQ53DRAFT_743399 [Thozetella sp. PMI_491]|nr:hypothetical protein GQ53DRAFT_743399 [Thozetella sp. PMI_491]